MNDEMKREEMKTANELIEAAIVRALDTRREPVVPSGFAAKVMQSLPAAVPAKPRLAVGRATAIAGAAVLTVVLFVLAPHSAPSFANVTFDVELLLLAQMGGIAWWLGVRREA